jgi:hypothetical protein
MIIWTPNKLSGLHFLDANSWPGAILNVNPVLPFAYCIPAADKSYG